jgi:hypothetical protein
MVGGGFVQSLFAAGKSTVAIRDSRRAGLFSNAAGRQHFMLFDIVAVTDKRDVGLALSFAGCVT